jgi:cytochrome P450
VPIFNPFLPSYMRDPYAAYRRLRDDEPVHRSTVLQAWVVTGYEECREVLREPARYSSDPALARGPLAEQLQRRRRESPLGETATVLNSDPPAHTRLRALVSRAFTPRRVEGLRPHIAEVAAELLTRRSGSEPFELTAGLSEPLPVIVIAELLGVPPADCGLFVGWSHAIAATTDVLTTDLLVEEARAGVRELTDYLNGVIAERRASPRDDLISALVAAEEEGAGLSHDELLAFVILLLVAGNETTTSLLGNSVVALLDAPGELQALRERLAAGDGEALPRAVEELLRFDSPVQGVVRFARETGELAGVPIAEGEMLLLLVGAANRDPRAFDAPDELRLAREVGRNGARHLSFGLGPHFCLGAPLGRLEAEAALGALLEAFPRLEADGDVERRGTLLLRGVERLPLAPA